MKRFIMTGRGIGSLLKKVFVFIIAAGLIGMQGPPLSFGAENKLISMDFQDVPLKQILKVFSQQADMNFVASENIQDKKVTQIGRAHV